MAASKKSRRKRKARAVLPAIDVSGFKSPQMRASYMAWARSRPLCVQQLMSRFPLGTKVEHEGQLLHLLGYTENDMLILSSVDPKADYEGALAAKQYLCAAHLEPA